MKKRDLLLVFTTLCSLTMFLLLSSNALKHDANAHAVNDIYLDSEPQRDWNNCITKAGSDWGGKCLSYGHSDEMYSIYLTNSCQEMIDLMCCVQRTNGQWRCFYRMDMKNSDTLTAYACKSTGKHLRWVRKAGEVQVKFPTLNEVNEQY